MDNDGDAVVGDGYFQEIFFLGHKFPGGGPQVGGALPGGKDSGAGTAALNVDECPGVMAHVLLGQFFGKGLHRGGAGNAQGVGRLLPVAADPGDGQTAAQRQEGCGQGHNGKAGGGQTPDCEYFQIYIRVRHNMENHAARSTGLPLMPPGFGLEG
jgi:hypothetical protein